MNKMKSNLDGVIPVAFAVPSSTAPSYNSSPSAPNRNYPTHGDPSVHQLKPEPSFKIPPASPMMSMSGTLNDNQINQLVAQGFTRGLAKALGENNMTFPLRFWVVDNSGSMAAPDGCQMISSNSNTHVKMVSCTRWKEIQGTVDYHAQIAGLVQAPTIFRLLNNPGINAGPQEFGVANKGEDMILDDLQVAKNTMTRASPTGVTPLSNHIYDIREQIAILNPQLQSEGRRVVIVLATDGLPTDQYGVGGNQEKNAFVNAMKSLEGLPVWIVIRLCTNDESVVEFYNDLDAQLELSIEVLDDFNGEAEEVYRVNPWLNYSLPLHRMREMGFQNRLFDLLDERKLTKGELREFCIFLFGIDKFDGVPESEVDFKGFLSAISNLLKTEKMQWNPVKKQVLPLLDLKKLNQLYGDAGGCTII